MILLRKIDACFGEEPGPGRSRIALQTYYLPTDSIRGDEGEFY